MPKFSEHSLEKLATCHPDLQKLANALILQRDCIIVQGHRSQAEQEQYWQAGTTSCRFSPHNEDPSMAIDMMACPLDWGDIDTINEFRNLVDIVAKQVGVELHPLIRFQNKKGQWITDYPHYQLAEWHKPKETPNG
jgi:peptidoglycan LD-endopeptidase CwlK